MRRAGALLAPTVIALLLVACPTEDDGGGGERASSVASLSALTLSDGATAVTLTPTPFDPATTGYSASVGASVESVTVTATTTDGGATLTIDGTPTDSGTASGAIELTASGDTQIDIVVTAADTTATETYTITVTRASPPVLPPSSVAKQRRELERTDAERGRGDCRYPEPHALRPRNDGLQRLCR